MVFDFIIVLVLVIVFGYLFRVAVNRTFGRKVVELRKLTDCCPTQWEGKLADGRYIYIRFRWDTLIVRVARTEDEAFAPNSKPFIVIENVTGVDNAGEIDYDTMVKLLSHKFKFPPKDQVEFEG